MGRIVKIADVFDALASRRPYKDPYPVGVACDLMRKLRGEEFDPDLLDVFFDAMDEVLRIKNEADSNETLTDLAWSERDGMTST